MEGMTDKEQRLYLAMRDLAASSEMFAYALPSMNPYPAGGGNLTPEDIYEQCAKVSGLRTQLFAEASTLSKMAREAGRAVEMDAYRRAEAAADDVTVSEVDFAATERRLVEGTTRHGGRFNFVDTGAPFDPELPPEGFK